MNGNAYVRTVIYRVYNDSIISIGKLCTPFLVDSDQGLPSSSQEDVVFIKEGCGIPRNDVSMFISNSDFLNELYKFFYSISTNKNLSVALEFKCF